MQFNKVLNCYKLTINHTGWLRQGFLKKTGYELQRRDEISIDSQIPTLLTLDGKASWAPKPPAHTPRSLLFQLREVGSAQSQCRGPQRAPNLLPHGHIMYYSIHITFSQGSPETTICLSILHFMLISVASEPPWARSTLANWTGEYKIIRLIHYLDYLGQMI